MPASDDRDDPVTTSARTRSERSPRGPRQPRAPRTRTASRFESSDTQVLADRAESTVRGTVMTQHTRRPVAGTSGNARRGTSKGNLGEPSKAGAGGSYPS